MRNSKLGLRAIGLGALGALSLMAFFAAGAQAQKFLINLGAALLATATGGGGSMTLLVPSKALSIKCTFNDVQEGKISSSTEGLAKILFLECAPITHVGGIPITKCIIPGGTITASATLLPKSVGGTLYILAEPDSGELFATVTFEKEKGCPLPLSNPVKGTIAATLLAEKSTQIVTMNEAIQLTLAELKYGEALAYLIGTTTVTLSGAHTFLKWGIA